LGLLEQNSHHEKGTPLPIELHIELSYSFFLPLFSSASLWLAKAEFNLGGQAMGLMHFVVTASYIAACQCSAGAGQLR
jgi:hypothetical protein